MQRPPPPSGAPPRSARHTGRARRPEATAWTAAPGTAEAAEYLAAPNGKYLGDVVDGMAHGRGKFICTNGDTYEGEYRESAQHGYEYLGPIAAGAYSMVLSKAASLHRKYLHMYSATGERRAF